MKVSTMKVTVLAFIALASIFTVANGYRIGNCRTPDDFNLGNGECHNWTDQKFTYQSDKGCTLTFYEENCSGNTGKVWSTTTQNQCLDIPFAPEKMKCA